MSQNFHLYPQNLPLDSSSMLTRTTDNVQMSIGDLFGIRDAIIRHLLQNTQTGQDINRAILVAEMTAVGLFGRTGPTGPASGISGPDKTETATVYEA